VGVGEGVSVAVAVSVGVGGAAVCVGTGGVCLMLQADNESNKTTATTNWQETALFIPEPFSNCLNEY